MTVFSVCRATGNDRQRPCCSDRNAVVGCLCLCTSVSAERVVETGEEGGDSEMVS